MEERIIYYPSQLLNGIDLGPLYTVWDLSNIGIL
ncbi:hypothetical protein [Escherichia phage CLB_P2]|nr:hypothetical protein [Escherichia phage CLB_P2]